MSLFTNVSYITRTIVYFLDGIIPYDENIFNFYYLIQNFLPRSCLCIFTEGSASLANLCLSNSMILFAKT